MRKALFLSIVAVLAVLLTTFFTAHGAAPAQGSSAEILAEIQAMRDQIARLEARVAALEQSRATPPQVLPYLRPGVPPIDPDGYGNIQFQLVPTGPKDK